jgi:hypothetical protein
MVEPDTDVTLPKAAAKPDGTLKRRRGVERGAAPPKLLRPARGKTCTRLDCTEQLPETAVVKVTVVASRAPFLAVVPVAVMQAPLATAFNVTATVAVIRVFEVTFTVVWPISGLRTSSVLPEM